MKWLLYYWRLSSSSLELHTNYDWRAMAQNTHCGLFPICDFVHIWSRMFCFMLKAAKQLQPTNYGPTHILYCLVILYASTHRQQHSGRLWLYYTPNDHFTTKDASLYKCKARYDLRASVQFKSWCSITYDDTNDRNRESICLLRN